jgi:hypothetical protein
MYAYAYKGLCACGAFVCVGACVCVCVCGCVCVCVYGLHVVRLWVACCAAKPITLADAAAAAFYL